MVQVNRVCLKILFIDRPQFLVDSNDFANIITLIGNASTLLCAFVIVVRYQSFCPDGLESGELEVGFYVLVSGISRHFKKSGYHVNLISGQTAVYNREFIPKSSQDIISIVSIEIEAV